MINYDKDKDVTSVYGFVSDEEENMFNDIGSDEEIRSAKDVYLKLRGPVHLQGIWTNTVSIGSFTNDHEIT